MSPGELLRIPARLPAYEPRAHLVAVLGMLKSLESARHIANQTTSPLAERTHGTFADLVYLHTASALLAHAFECLFAHTLASLRSLHGSTPAGTHRRCRLAADDFWNPRLITQNDGTPAHVANVTFGFNEIMQAIDMRPCFPANFVATTDAIFAYRDQSLHAGYAWPPTTTTDFHAQIDRSGWVMLFSSAATSPGNVAITFPKDDFIRFAFDIAGQTAVACDRVCHESRVRLRGDRSPTPRPEPLQWT